MYSYFIFTKSVKEYSNIQRSHKNLSIQYIAPLALTYAWLHNVCGEKKTIIWFMMSCFLHHRVLRPTASVLNALHIQEPTLWPQAEPSNVYRIVIYAVINVSFVLLSSYMMSHNLHASHCLQCAYPHAGLDTSCSHTHECMLLRYIPYNPNKGQLLTRAQPSYLDLCGEKNELYTTQMIHKRVSLLGAAKSSSQGIKRESVKVYN